MISRKEALDYEVLASAWWTSWISWGWLQNLAASYFVWKVSRKYARYEFWTTRSESRNKA